MEVACPVLDEAVRARLFHIIDELQRDNVKARVMGPDGAYHRKKENEAPRSCQEVFQREEPQVQENSEPSLRVLLGRIIAALRRAIAE
ncbi:MAG: hypothetical protein LUD79_04585 [Oscillospiraceae bacterium]|nr:hypothetical protein [Oscillospiraceae bacterium]